MKRLVVTGIVMILAFGSEVANSAPSRIVDFDASAIGSTGLIVSFTQPSGAVRYEVKYRTTALTAFTWGGATVVTGVPTPTTVGTMIVFNIDGFAPSTKFYIGVKAQAADGTWATLSNVITPTTTAIPPPPPEPPSPPQVVLTWPYSAESEAKIQGGGFRVYYGLKSKTDPTWSHYEHMEPVAPESRQATIALEPATTYYFVVRAYKANGEESIDSNEVTVP